YGAFSFYDFHRGVGPFLAGALVRTDVTGPAARELVKELHAIQTNPPTASEVALSKDFALRSLPGRFETAQSTSRLIGDLFVYNLPANYYRSLPAQYDSVAPEAVATAAQKEVHPNEMVILAIGDRQKIQPELEKLSIGPIELRDTLGNLLTK